MDGLRVGRGQPTLFFTCTPADVRHPLVLRLVDSRSLQVKTATALLVALPASLMIAQVNQMVFADVQDRIYQDYAKEQGIVIRRDESGNLLVEFPPIPRAQRTGTVGTTGAAADRREMDLDDGEGRTFVLAPAPKGAERWRQLSDIALGRYFLLLAWAALYLAMLAGAQARASQVREERFRTAAKAAELRSLRYQINPHFLFNTLNSLSALVMTGKADRAEQMIQTISRFYRHSLADHPTGDVSLEDEIDLQEHYLAIEAVRFPERLRIKVDLPPELARYQVPGMILQPLVENSVKYGVSASRKPVTINARTPIEASTPPVYATPCPSTSRRLWWANAATWKTLMARIGSTHGIRFRISPPSSARPNA